MNGLKEAIKLVVGAAAYLILVMLLIVTFAVIGVFVSAYALILAVAGAHKRLDLGLKARQRTMDATAVEELIESTKGGSDGGEENKDL